MNGRFLEKKLREKVIEIKDKKKQLLLSSSVIYFTHSGFQSLTPSPSQRPPPPGLPQRLSANGTKVEFFIRDHHNEETNIMITFLILESARYSTTGKTTAAPIPSA